MTKDLIIKRVKEQFYAAEVHQIDENKVWFVLGIATSKGLQWARLPYWQILPRDSSTVWLVVMEKF